MTLEPWFRRRPLTGYFALAYGICWGGILILLTRQEFRLGCPMAKRGTHCCTMSRREPYAEIFTQGIST